jgi:hypothetical protein
MIQRTAGNKKRITPPDIPVVPDVKASWLEALRNSNPGSAPAPTAFVGQGSNKPPTAAQLESRAQAEQNYQNYYNERVPVRYGDVYNNSAKTLAGAIFRYGVREPIEGLHRTVTGQNLSTYMNPFNDASTGERLSALGEDALNVASVVPFLRGAGIIGKTAKTAKTGLSFPKSITRPATYEYGIHTSAYPNIEGSINSARFTNMGGAGDALPNSSYQWRLSPQTGVFSNAEMANRATPSAQNWAARLMDRTMMDDSEAARITQYLTRGPASKAGPDLNVAPKYDRYGKLQGMDSLYENTASVVESPLEILGKVPYNPNQEEYAQSIQNMIASRKREIALNNVRLMYERGLLPKGYNLPPKP